MQPGQRSGRTISTAGQTVLLFVDLQSSLSSALTVPKRELHTRNGALARLAVIFDIPVVISTLADTEGFAADIFSEVTAELASVPVIQRTTPNSMNDDAVRLALDETCRRRPIVSGITTEAAVMPPCLSAALEGFDVHVAVDCCGGVSARSEDAALRRMAHAGINLSSLPALASELIADVTEPKGRAAMDVLFDLTRRPHTIGAAL